MNNFSTYKRMYFLGIGGIGMSALARYFHREGVDVIGYDLKRTSLTDELINEGIPIHFEDKGAQIIADVGDAKEVLIVITPAIPKSLNEFSVLKKNGYVFVKRAELLGWVTREKVGLAVAGTHGKTTTSCLLAHVLKNSGLGCNAFLGGISADYKTNFIADKSSKYAVVEADEFDRSFLYLRPFASILTSMDADHLDIYGDHSQVEQAFKDYVQKIDPTGFLIKHEAISISHTGKNRSYGLSNKESDYFATQLRYVDGMFVFNLKTPLGSWDNVELGIPGVHNVENAMAVIGLCVELGLTEHEIRSGLRSFSGVQRRFEIVYRSQKQVYIDDYAHHPTAIEQLIKSVRLMFPHRKIMGIFQPHLYSRTKDFMDRFAWSLAGLDRLVLLPIYPAREEPIQGVTSEALYERVKMADKSVLQQVEVPNQIKDWEGVILTIGAGDISELVPPLKKLLNE